MRVPLERRIRLLGVRATALVAESELQPGVPATVPRALTLFD